MSIILDGTNGITLPSPSTLYSVTQILSSAPLTAPVIKDSNSVEIGQFAKAWGKIVTSTTPTVVGFNISSVTFNSTGNWTINFTNAVFNNSAYSGYATFDGNYNVTSGINTQTSGNCVLTSKTGAGAGYNPGYMLVAFFG